MSLALTTTHENTPIFRGVILDSCRSTARGQYASGSSQAGKDVAGKPREQRTSITGSLHA